MIYDTEGFRLWLIKMQARYNSIINLSIELEKDEADIDKMRCKRDIYRHVLFKLEEFKEDK